MAEKKESAQKQAKSPTKKQPNGDTAIMVIHLIFGGVATVVVGLVHITVNLLVLVPTIVVGGVVWLVVKASLLVQSLLDWCREKRQEWRNWWRRHHPRRRAAEEE
jgi:Flp pilus assembly protein TadB